ncbi:related to FCP1-TFIIF interacting component of CTD phosphatase [Sporisorium reilianum SRZ2]|uniref:RNA polymerase II subunit A C-terminal domain phosphatase n=1 Tax=Sporisorium reilianum (strain SRZ2) TaxID=999809 RepID=E6ZKZ2_SPORE|nr:related to FCP1-TFIIF interacting component of CTD phosphatase [Sporisorium reilianum SRZ2]
MSQAAEECKHPVQLFGMCAVCGQPVDADSEESASLSVMHSSAAVKVSAEEAQRLDSESTSHLLSQRKLALIVDLDQTVIHATVDPTVGEWMRDESNPNYDALQSVGKFRLGIDGEEIKDDDDESAPRDSAAALRASRACWYYVKPRPGVPKVLKQLSEKYQLHVYTMGTRSYANCVCKLIDPDASIFGNRILSRDENGSLVRKSLSRLFPVDHSMVVIIDDREDVWSRSPNLLPVLPYEFFVGIGDINATFLPTPPPPPGALPAAIASTSASKPDEATNAASSSASSAGSDAASASNGSSTPATTPEKAVEEAVQKAEAEGRTEEELQAVREAAAHFAAQTEKLQSKLAEQREARPLAKMQEALDVKLGKHSNGASRSGTATPNGNGEGVGAPASGADSSSGSSSEGSESPTGEPSGDSSTPAAATPEDTPESAPATSLPPLPPPPPPLPPHRSHAVLVDDDTELDRVQSILDDLHTQWYARYDAMQARPKPQPASDPTIQKPSVVDLISARKAHVLQGCTIVFSSMIPFGHDPEKSDLWAMAREFGATPSSEIEAGVTTHVVAARPGTAKVHQALRLAQKSAGLEVVWPSWFHVSASRWARQDEGLYRISASENTLASANAAADAATAESAKAETKGNGESSAEADKAEPAAKAQGDDGETLFENELNDMDWSAAADEVDAYLDSATTASNTSSPSPSMLAADAELPDVDADDALSSNGASRKRGRTEEGEADTSKKPRSDAAAAEDDDDDDGGDSFLDDLAEELDGQLDNE